MKWWLAELCFDGEMLVEMNGNQQDLEDEAVRLFHVMVHWCQDIIPGIIYTVSSVMHNMLFPIFSLG